MGLSLAKIQMTNTNAISLRTTSKYKRACTEVLKHFTHTNIQVAGMLITKHSSLLNKSRRIRTQLVCNFQPPSEFLHCLKNHKTKFLQNNLWLILWINSAWTSSHSIHQGDSDGLMSDSPCFLPVLSSLLMSTLGSHITQ